MSKLTRYTRLTWTAARHFDQREVDENDAEIRKKPVEPSDSALIHSSRNSSRFENFFYACFPNLLLQSTPWEEQWNRKERSENIAVWRVVFLIIPLVYIAHYYFLDKPMGLTPN